MKPNTCLIYYNVCDENLSPFKIIFHANANANGSKRTGEEKGEKSDIDKVREKSHS